MFNVPDLLEEPEALFVYGTLRTADPRAVAMIYGKLHDVGVAVATHVGEEKAGVIRGELLYCEKEYLETTLDRYEGYPRFYGRERVVTVYPEEIPCWVYVAGPVRGMELSKKSLLKSPACWHEEFYELELEQEQRLLDLEERSAY